MIYAAFRAWKTLRRYFISLPSKTAFYCVTKSREPTTNESDVFSVLACTLFVSVDDKLVSILPYHRKAKVFRATDKQGIVLKTEYDAEAAFLTLYMGEQERRFFHALCYAVGAEKALLQAVLRVCIWRGKGFIPYPPKPRFYCVTNPKQRSYELWQFSEWNGTRATP